ncbi:MAG: DUF6036 family nucleotidyltransferase [Burkholderiales bacterium]
MKKQHVEHVLRAAARITGEKQFIIVGSQSLHGKFPDIPDEIEMSVEVDVIARNDTDRTEWLNAIGQDSVFHETYGYYADPVDESTATLPKGWKGRLVNLPTGDSGGVVGLCLEPHDLAISKYVARREKDLRFTRELARRGVTRRERLLELLRITPVGTDIKSRMEADILADFSVTKPARRKR